MRLLPSQLPVEVVEVSYLFPELVLPGLWRARAAASERGDARDYYSFAVGADGLGGRTRIVVGIAARAKAALDRHTFRRVLEFAGTQSPRILDVGDRTGEMPTCRVEAFGTDARCDAILMLNLIEHVEIRSGRCAVPANS
jgi:hypothetical protein